MKKNCLIAACAGLAMASLALASPPAAKLRVAKKATKIDPIQVASVRLLPHGQVALTSPWMAYHGNSQRQDPNDAYIFDDYDGDDTGFPAGADLAPCSFANATTRYWFGSAYRNPVEAEDMTNDAGFGSKLLNGINAGFAWNPTAATGAHLILVYFMFEEMINDTDCSVDTFQDTATGDGVALDYGNVTAGAGGYYYTNVEALTDAVSVYMPAGTSGSYEAIFANSIDSAIHIAANNCQYMLWGCSNNGGTPGRVGTQAEQALDDDNPTDGAFTVDECYTYAYGLCVDPFGKMNGFLVKGCTGSGDYNGDGFITGEDFDQFVQDFEAGGCEDGTGSGCRGATDHNGDGFQTGEDFDSFVQDFEAGCQ
jgi:hypothetical protein